MKIPLSKGFGVGVNEAATGGMRAQQLVNAGASAGRVGQQLFELGGQMVDKQIQIANQMNELASENALAEVKLYEQELRLNPDFGYEALKGENALNRPDGQSITDEYDSMFMQRAEELKGRLKNDQQKAMFEQGVMGIRSTLRAGTQKHLFQEGRQWQKDSLSSQVDLLAQSFERASSADEERGLMAKLGDAFRKRQQFEGWGEEKALHEERKLMTGAIERRAKRMIDNGQTGEARDFVNRYQIYMTGEDYNKIHDLANAAAQEELAVVLAKNAVNAGEFTLNVPVHLLDGGSGSQGYTGAYYRGGSVRNSKFGSNFSNANNNQNGAGASAYRLVAGNGAGARVAAGVVQTVRGMGVPDAVAAALIGQMVREGTLNEAGAMAKNHHGDAANSKTNVGIINFQGTRKAAFEQYVAQRGGIRSAEDGIRLQTEYVFSEMKRQFPKEYKRLMETNDVNEAAKIMDKTIGWDDVGNTIGHRLGGGAKALGQHYAKMAGAAEAAVHKFGLNVAGGSQAARAVTIKGNSYEEQRESLGRQVGFTSNTFKQTDKELKRAWAEKERQLKQADEERDVAVQNAIIQSGGDLNAVPKSVRAGWTPKQRMQYENLAEGIVEKDEKRRYKANEMSFYQIKNNPEELAKLTDNQIWSMAKDVGVKRAQELIEDRNRYLKAEEKGAGKTSPPAVAADVVNVIANDLGLKVSGKGAKAEDVQRKHWLIENIKEIQQSMFDRNGKWPNNAELMGEVMPMISDVYYREAKSKVLGVLPWTEKEEVKALTASPNERGWIYKENR